MKKSVLVVLMVLVLGSGVAFGQVTYRASANATATVYANIVPNISVSGPTVAVNLAGTGNGFAAGQEIPGNIQFTVHANSQEVDMQVVATDLYKGDDPTSTFRIPISSTGAQITCAAGSQLHGGSGLLPWQTTPPPGMIPASWTGAVSQIGTFTAGTNGTFSQAVTVGLSWKTSDFELPQGEYSGFVKLIAMVQ